MPRDVARLRFLSNQLLIRLPGLIKIVRCLRNGVETEANMVRVNHLIEQLKELQDDTAESGMLHRVQVVKTSEAEDIEFVPVSFEFKDVLELEAAVLYWKSHMFLGNLQLKLSELSQSKIDTTQEILDVMERMGCNIMMAHQYAKARPQHTHSRGMVAMGTAWMSVWALWDHIPELKGIDRGRWRSWTLQKFNEAIKVWHIQACDQDMNQTSDLFAGGPLVGFLVRAYALA
ncbi:hypothetical protein HII31_09329 [Pseudocercospora fuligena]|uniref:Uncharacterized protein n=1 Tax=Pseudocercospora fuligena TaxID=685502 RepID=A0A8H6RFZ0_9PEZI|nr:hypothetical protein HII31_09329 [Pseudocercospora fuligena]